MPSPRDWFRRPRTAALSPESRPLADPFLGAETLRLSPFAATEGGFHPHMTKRPIIERSQSNRLQNEPLPPRTPSARPRQPDPDPVTDQDPSGNALPRFALTAAGTGWAGQTGGLGAARALKLREAFTPTRPKQQGGQFSGRHRQMQRIIAAIEEERAHIVIHGERGSGKTSLANMIGGSAEQAGYLVQRFACSSDLTFEEIFRPMMRRVPASAMADGIGSMNRAGIANFEEFLPRGNFGPIELIEALHRLDQRHLILIIDEYDRVTDNVTRSKMAELIKNMSDAATAATLILIGVAGTVEELLGRHPSLQRSLVIVPLPLMSDREIDGLILAGAQRAEIEFPVEIRQAIIHFARGLPYHAQSLSLASARHAVQRDSLIVERGDLAAALERASVEADSTIRSRYAEAIAESDEVDFRALLFAAANAPGNEFGVFDPASLVFATPSGGNESNRSLHYPLKKLTEPERGSVLQRVPVPNGWHYQFCNQMVRHYVLVREARDLSHW